MLANATEMERAANVEEDGIDFRTGTALYKSKNLPSTSQRC